jgi:hypothetical protein
MRWMERTLFEIPSHVKKYYLSRFGRGMDGDYFKPYISHFGSGPIGTLDKMGTIFIFTQILLIHPMNDLGWF